MDFLAVAVLSLVSHFTPSCQMAITFLLAPPSDTLGLVLKSPSKLNIVSFFPLTDSGMATDS